MKIARNDLKKFRNEIIKIHKSLVKIMPEQPKRKSTKKYCMIIILEL